MTQPEQTTTVESAAPAAEAPPLADLPGSPLPTAAASPGEVTASDLAAGPTRPAAIDLDSLEREGAQGPFDFVLEHKRYLLSDPQEVDWQDLIAALSNPVMFFRLTLPAEDRVQFFTTRIPTWKMHKLINAYLEHYGIPSGPNAGGLLR